MIGLVCKAHRLLYHSTLGLRVMKEKKTVWDDTGPESSGLDSSLVRSFLSSFVSSFCSSGSCSRGFGVWCYDQNLALTAL